MAMKEGKPPYGDYDATAHAKQPHGKSIGTGDQRNWSSRGVAAGSGSEPSHSKPPANIPVNTEGSSLAGDCGVGHAKQPSGHSIGTGSMGGAEHHKGFGMGSAYTFRQPPMRDAHSFPGTHKSGAHRMSGHKGAHMIGRK